MLRRVMMAGHPVADHPAAFRYWRVYITANNGNATYTHIGELEFRDASGVRLNPVKTDNTDIQYSSFNSPANPPFHGMDGVTASGTSPWITASGQESPCFLGYDFGVPIEVAKVALLMTSTINRSPRDFEFQASNDNATWIPVGSVIGQTAWASGVFIEWEL